MIEVVFRETDRSFVYRAGTDGEPLGEWEARPLRPVTESIDGGPAWGVVRGRLTTIREDRDGWFRWMTRGRHPSGNRYHEASSLSEAQERVQQWAQRRFRYAGENEEDR